MKGAVQSENAKIYYLLRETARMRRKIASSLQRDGITGVIRLGVRHVVWRIGIAFDNRNFDRGRNVNTCGIIGLWRFQINSANAKYGTAYQPVDPRAFQGAVRAMNIQPSEFTFVDLGCGKGRALLLAADYGFRRLIGIDFVPELVSTAKSNCEKVGLKAELIVGDAASFKFPEGRITANLAPASLRKEWSGAIRLRKILPSAPWGVPGRSGPGLVLRFRNARFPSLFPLLDGG